MMTDAAKAILKITPFEKGVESNRRVLIRKIDEPVRFVLTKDEYDVVNELVENPIAVDEFLATHLGGEKGLGFKQAVDLLSRLYSSGFVQDVTSHERLNEFADKAYGNAAAGVKLFTAAIVSALNLTLLDFERTQIHPIFRGVGRALVSTPAMVIYLLLIGGLIGSGASVLPDTESLFYLFSKPEYLLVKVFFVFSVSASFLAFIQMAALAGSGVKFVGGKIKLTGFCIIRIETNDDDITSLSKWKMFRYHLFSIVSPWVWALVFWQFVAGSSLVSVQSMMAGAFSIIGVIVLCPLYRSPVIKMAEGFLVLLDFLETSNNYLIKGLFKGFTKKEREGEDKTLSAMAGVSASLAMVWLYVVSLLFADLFIGALPGLAAHIMEGTNLVRSVASAIILVVLVLAVVIPFLKLVFIPIQNIASAAALPIRKARKGITSYKETTLTPSEAITAFLKEIPIFSQLSTSMFGDLTGVLRFVPYGRGQDIIKQGDEGKRFYILADGQAQVIIEKPEGGEVVVDILRPGDSFGEIALVENVKRTATIRALTPVKTLSLSKINFDNLFPENSKERIDLTGLIRRVKLILESQALSHLTPSQIRELLNSCETVSYEANDVLIKEGEIGDAAYLIQDGNIGIVDGSGKEMAEMERGALVGVIAIVKDIPRTATVVAKSKCSCLKIKRETFLKMCMSNIFVAMLVHDLTDKQYEDSSVG